MNKFWDNVGYLTLTLLVIGNLTVGYVYLFAQTLFAIANGMNAIRAFQLKRPLADKTREIVFFAMTIGLIIIRLRGF